MCCNLNRSQFVWPCHAVHYKLLNYSEATRGKAGGVPATNCQEGCSRQGLVLMPLNSLNEFKHVLELPNYNYTHAVYTAGVERTINGVNSLYSSSGGTKINFAVNAILGERKAGYKICILIYYSTFYLRNCSLGKVDMCACKAKGELLLLLFTITLFYSSPIAYRG